MRYVIENGEADGRRGRKSWQGNVGMNSKIANQTISQPDQCQQSENNLGSLAFKAVEFSWTTESEILELEEMEDTQV